MKKNIFKLIPVIVIIVIMAATVVYFLARQPKISYQDDQIATRNITEEVDLNGKVKAAQDVDLSFERSGTISKVYVKAGDKVKAGQMLVSLENADAAAGLAQANAALNKALAGSTPEYLAGLQDSLDKAQADLSLAEGTAPGVEGSKLVQNAYDDTLSNLQSAQITLSSSLTSADDILGIDNILANDAFETYLSILDAQKLAIAKESYLSAKQSKNDFDTAFNQLDNNSDHQSIDQAVQNGEAALLEIKDLLFNVSAVLDNTLPVANLSQASLDIMKGNIQLARTGVAGKYTALVDQAHAIDTARNNFYSLQALVNKAKSALQDAKNPPRAVDVAGFRAAVSLAAVNYNKTLLRAPFAGIIARQEAKIGAAAIPGAPLTTVISGKLYEVETYVPESDIAQIKAGDTAAVTLDNLGSSVLFPAKVVEINPASERTSDGSVSYKVTLEFNQEDPRIKVDLTANIKITAAQKNNVLAISERDVVQKDGEYYAMVDNGQGQLEQKPVQIGIKGQDGYWEIISGVSLGDKVVSFGS